MKRFIKMNEEDFVGTALDNILEGEIVGIYNGENDFLGNITVKENIPFGNKIALENLSVGSSVIKYGSVIGECTKNINKGFLVHVHNVKSLSVDIPMAFKKEIMRQMNIEDEV